MPWGNHYGLELRRNGMVDRFQRVESDQTRLSTLGTPGSEHGSPMVAEAAGQNRQMAVGAFVCGRGTRWWKISEILGRSPFHFTAVRTRSQSNIGSHFEPAD